MVNLMEAHRANREKHVADEYVIQALLAMDEFSPFPPVPKLEVRGVIREGARRILRAMILPDHLEAQRRAPREARAAERRAAQQRAAESSAKVDMRVPVYFDELAVGLRLAVYGEGDSLVQAMCVHNGHLHKHGAQGKIETGQ